MFLKTLTLKGFKSFADTTNLDLEPGITVVVGPNGSGKSNVVDAIAWVLGAQAPSAVRSQKMDDVIFAGTTKRSALGRAEVSLTIDNSAGLLPIDFTEVTITRILFRTGESEYAINGVPCRLLDIQDLLSDSGVGRQQHVIVSQGQIDAVLNARAEERRFIIEEAAGVLKYRRRKEKAERRLSATEGNLLRIQDLLREVRRQLRPLERQADAARRHGDVVAELSALRIFLAGRELATLRAKLDADARSKEELSRAERDHRDRLAQLDTEVMAAESRLTAVGGDDLGDDLVAFESLRERARGLAAVLAERARGIERERSSQVDQAIVANLEAESARLDEELASVGQDAEALAPLMASLAEDEEALDADRARFDADWGEGVAPPSGRAAEVRGELGALVSSLERGETELARVDERLAGLDAAAARLEAEAERLRGELAAAEAAEEPLVGRLDGAERRRAIAEGAVESARDALSAAEGDRSRWQARAEALGMALDAARARAGAERLSGVDGVVGTLLDVVEVDAGWEAAFEAAAGDAITAVVVDGVDAGRRALDALVSGDTQGAVLALGARHAAAPAAPPIGEPVRRHVRSANRDVEALLDQLIGAAVAVDGGWSAAVDAALGHPGAVVVTRDGSRFGASGWRIGVAGTGATGAALEEANERVAAASELAEAAAGALAAAEADLATARAEQDAIAKELDANDGLLSAAGDALQRVETERRDATTQGEELRSRRDEQLARLERDRARRRELEATLPMLEDEEAERIEQGKALAAARTRLEQRTATLTSRRRELEVRAAGVDQRRTVLTQRRAEIDQRLERHAEERQQANERRVEVERRARATHRLAGVVSEHLAVIEERLADLHERRRAQSETARAEAAALDALRKERSEVERALGEVRERLARIELGDAETRVRIETAVEALRRDLDVDPDTAIAAEMPDLPEGATPAARVRELERELRLMGPINPLALEEFEALQERHTFLQAQLDDVKSTRRDLAKIIRAIDGEIVEVFAAAFADVSENFARLFETLFPGGRGRLRLTDPDDMLTTGIEVEARPSGKNVRKLSLLSGGERSLTALAYLFAVFRSRPSPFYVMDEVEAALDDVNLHRFLDLIHEFREEAQLLIVSHQKRTMEAADCLYGVTMQPGGSSRVVSEKVSSSH
ncbi:chromosome segregation protein SMC [Actinomarinicola tropica]|uniref:Chromosome partition protein Smc n=1 Tax=Actinomarinicola tropica TaxID=2789776 RepID=A0A5Q2RGT4_9ACTN|nr:chromosome segregation protein SMC [Actinomarinicola tropica]QGG94844.1 chromosome segregation protein SMC [Actinomarinicola tropica]